MGKITKISTVGMSREDWLIQRKKTIGGSEAAAIVGLSKYASPYSVWADKTNRLPDQPDNEAMRQGRDLEEYVAKRWSEATGKKVHRVNAMLYNSDYPHSHADIDRAVTGERAGLECKTTRAINVKQFKNCEFPEKYYMQCVHYLAVTGWDRWYLAVLVFGEGLYTYTLERDEEEIEALMKAENSFWGHVEKDEPPVVDGLDATTETLQTIYAGGDTEEVDLFAFKRELDHYLALKAQEKDLKAEINETGNIIKDCMKDSEKGRCDDIAVTWQSRARKTFDLEEFKQDHPEIDLTPYYNTTVSRTFSVKIKN